MIHPIHPHRRPYSYPGNLPHLSNPPRPRPYNLPCPHNPPPHPHNLYIYAFTLYASIIHFQPLAPTISILLGFINKPSSYDTI